MIPTLDSFSAFNLVYDCPGQLFLGVLNPDQSVYIDASREGLLHKLLAQPEKD